PAVRPVRGRVPGGRRSDGAHPDVTRRTPDRGGDGVPRRPLLRPGAPDHGEDDVIRWEQVEVAYNGRRVLGPVTVEAGDGEWLGPIGANGAGESTTLKSAGGPAEHRGCGGGGAGVGRPGAALS